MLNDITNAGKLADALAAIENSGLLDGNEISPLEVTTDFYKEAEAAVYGPEATRNSTLTGTAIYALGYMAREGTLDALVAGDRAKQVMPKHDYADPATHMQFDHANDCIEQGEYPYVAMFLTVWYVAEAFEFDLLEAIANIS